MRTMKKKTANGDLVVRLPDETREDLWRIGQYKDDGWDFCPKKCWKRSGWGDCEHINTKD